MDPAELATIVGRPHVITDPDDMVPYIRDWSGRFTGKALAVVSPADAEEVSAIVQLCGRRGVAVHPQGGNTSLVGGGIPGSITETVVVRTHRMNWIAEPDPVANTVRVGAGATLADVQQSAARIGRMYGVDIASRATATVGGTIATNAGGIRVCAFGMTREQVVGLEAVFPNGRIVSHMRGLEKDNTGLRWPDLLVGAEGTLGVITAATLKLRPAVHDSTVVLVGCQTLAEVQQVVADVAGHHRLLAAELVEDKGMQLALELAEIASLPMAAPFYLLLEVAGDDLDIASGLPTIGAVDSRDRRSLWQLRELQSEAAAAMGRQYSVPITKLDVSVPTSQLPRLRASISAILADRDGVHDHYTFGHVADGNLHIEIAVDAAQAESVSEQILRLVTELGGSISAEHGVGRAKAKYLKLSRSSDEIALMRQLKTLLDPNALMAPGVLFEERPK